MPAPLSPHEKLDILKRNLRPDYKQVLVFKPVNTLSELMLIGKTIDASKTSIYQKVFGVPKEVSTISSKPAYDGYRQSQQQQQPRDNGKVLSLRYHQGAKTFGVAYHRDKDTKPLAGYADADYGGDVDDRHSISGGSVTWLGNLECNQAIWSNLLQPKKS
ncbi:uncharacterized protein LOC134290599 [Aedes albopictus]|uniref:Uncharacterized protein n=1 Tax=Aedes albopictus TaxID=7160 RepID=A0ABM1ZUJ5_AEDAL